MTDPVKTLAAAVASQGEVLQGQIAESFVWQTVLLALVHSHPSPPAFAAEFRRWWLLRGSQHSNAEHGQAWLAGVEAALDLLEAACPAPLRVRPPRRE